MEQNSIRKAKENVSGRFFTTNCCIGCDACVVIAPKNFKALPDGQYVVVRQPENSEQLSAVIEAYKSTFAPNGPGPCIVDSEDKPNIPEGLILE